MPLWLAELWWAELGAERARALLAAVNQPAESALRVNTLVASAADVAAALGVATRAAPGPARGPGARGAVRRPRLGPVGARRAHAPVAGVDGRGAGARRPSRASACWTCARRPGAKTTHLAALAGDEGELVAVERHAGRADALRRTLERMHVRSATVEIGDAGGPAARGGV